MRSQLRPLLTSWRGAFPHSVKEMTTEQAGGSLHSWLIALENRTGALACKCVCMYVCLFVSVCVSWGEKLVQSTNMYCRRAYLCRENLG